VRIVQNKFKNYQEKIRDSCRGNWNELIFSCNHVIFLCIYYYWSARISVLRLWSRRVPIRITISSGGEKSEHVRRSIRRLLWTVLYDEKCRKVGTYRTFVITIAFGRLRLKVLVKSRVDTLESAAVVINVPRSYHVRRRFNTVYSF